MSELVLRRHEVAEADRPRVMPTLFPGRIAGMPGYLWGEATLFNITRKLCTAYTGGLWTYYAIAEGGHYAAPRMGNEQVLVSWAENWFEGSMTPDALGIVATLFALSSASFVSTDDRIARNFMALRDYAIEHPEAKQIFRAID